MFCGTRRYVLLFLRCLWECDLPVGEKTHPLISQRTWIECLRDQRCDPLTTRLDSNSFFLALSSSRNCTPFAFSSQSFTSIFSQQLLVPLHERCFTLWFWSLSPAQPYHWSVWRVVNSRLFALFGLKGWQRLGDARSELKPLKGNRRQVIVSCRTVELFCPKSNRCFTLTWPICSQRFGLTSHFEDDGSRGPGVRVKSGHLLNAPAAVSLWVCVLPFVPFETRARSETCVHSPSFMG